MARCDFLKRISVEPAVFLSAFAWNIFAIANDLGMYRVICDQFFNADGGNGLNSSNRFECWDTRNSLGASFGTNGSAWWRQAEITLQKEMALFTIISNVMVLLPSTIAIVILGAYGDRRGRKGVFLLCISGVIIAMVPLPVLFSAPLTTPIFITYIANLLAGLTGSIGGIITIGAAHLSDTVKEKDMLTIRMTILQLAFTLSSILGPLAAVGLMTAFNYTWTVVCAMVIGCAAFLSVLVLFKRVRVMPQMAPQAQTEKEGETKRALEGALNGAQAGKIVPIQVTSGKSNKENGKARIGNIIEVIKDTPSLLAESWRTMSKAREGRKRTYILVVTVINFITATTDALFIGPVFTLYVQKTPISWAQNQVSTYRAITHSIRLIAGAGGIFIFKKKFHMNDTSIIILSVLSHCGRMVIFAVSSNSWMLYVAAAIGLLTILMYPCTQAFLTNNVERNEVGKAHGVFGLVTGLSFFLGTVGAGTIYKATVDIFAPLIFVFSAAMLGIALAMAGWLHWSSREKCKLNKAIVVSS